MFAAMTLNKFVPTAGLMMISTYPLETGRMTTNSRRSWVHATAMILPIALAGCGGAEKDATPAPAALPQSAQAPSQGVPGGMGGGPATGIKGVMRTVAAGPNSLTPKIGAALKGDSPDWAAIQAQTKEYATLAKTLGTFDPPKGTKESWKTMTDNFAETATDMDTAAQAKDLAAARAAQDTLSKSCMACHNAHQNKGPRGMGGPGGPGGPGRGGPGGDGLGGGPPGGGPPPQG